jgi:hypothetical protein
MTPFIIGAIIGSATTAYGLSRNWSVHKSAIVAASLSVAVVSALWIVGGIS